jgi:hypothetical protein
MLRDHAAVLRARSEPLKSATEPAKPPTIPPPPKSLGVQTNTGSWKFSEHELDEWQKRKDNEEKAQRWNVMLSGGWKLALAIMGTVAASEIVHRLLEVHV